MGLFGGFKGKLIGSSKKKEKSGKSQVVCVKFNTFSEFDSQSAIPSCSTDNLGQNEVIKERRRPTKPEIESFFEKMVATTANKQVKPGNSSITDKQVKPQDATPAGKQMKPGNSTITDKQVKPQDATPADKQMKPEAAILINKQANSDLSKEKGATKKSTKQKLPAPKQRKAPVPKSPVKAVKTKPVKEVPKPETKTTREIEATPDRVLTVPTIQFPLEISDDDEDDDDNNDGNFKIHFATNLNHNFGNVSDHDSYVESEQELSPITYSSQATSIFFGDDEEPMVMRPRKVIVNDDDFSDGSSASA